MPQKYKDILMVFVYALYFTNGVLCCYSSSKDATPVNKKPTRTVEIFVEKNSNIITCKSENMGNGDVLELVEQLQNGTTAMIHNSITNTLVYNYQQRSRKKTHVFCQVINVSKGGPIKSGIEEIEGLHFEDNAETIGETTTCKNTKEETFSPRKTKTKGEEDDNEEEEEDFSEPKINVQMKILSGIIACVVVIFVLIVGGAACKKRKLKKDEPTDVSAVQYVELDLSPASKSFGPMRSPESQESPYAEIVGSITKINRK